MKKRLARTWNLAVILGAAVCLPAMAADAVYLKDSPSDSIELTNLNDADNPQSPVVSNSSAKDPGTPSPNAAATVPAKAAAGNGWVARKKAKAKCLESEEASTDCALEEGQTDETQVDSAALANGSEPAKTENASKDTDAKGAITGSAYSGYSGYSTTSGFNESAVNTTDTTASAPNSTGASTGPSPKTTTIGTAVAGSNGSGTGSGASIGLTSAQSALAQYRNLMLQEAASANYINSNPAVSRRYLQVDRTTYQTRIGQ